VSQAPVRVREIRKAVRGNAQVASGKLYASSLRIPAFSLRNQRFQSAVLVSASSAAVRWMLVSLGAKPVSCWSHSCRGRIAVLPLATW